MGVWATSYLEEKFPPKRIQSDAKSSVDLAWQREMASDDVAQLDQSANK